MAGRIYARRYARAVFEIALERNEVERWYSDLEELSRLVEDTILLNWLEASSVSFETKVQFLTGQFPGINLLALNLVYMLAARGGLNMLGEVTAEYQKLADSHRGIERAEVITAIPIDDEQGKLLAKGLADMIGKKEVVIASSVDEEILGGFVARIGDRLLDGSTRSRLKALKKDLAARGR